MSWQERTAQSTLASAVPGAASPMADTPAHSLPTPSRGPLTDAGRGVLVGLREEVRQCEHEGTCSQQETANADQPRPVHPAAKVADEDDEGGVADLWREQPG